MTTAERIADLEDRLAASEAARRGQHTVIGMIHAMAATALDYLDREAPTDIPEVPEVERAKDAFVQALGGIADQALTSDVATYLDGVVASAGGGS